MVSCPPSDPIKEVSVSLNLLLVKAPEPEPQNPFRIEVQNKNGEKIEFSLYPKNLPSAFGEVYYYIMTLPSSLSNYSHVSIDDSLGNRELVLDQSKLKELEVAAFDVTYRSSGGVLADLYEESRGDTATGECLASWLGMDQETIESNSETEELTPQENSNQLNFLWENMAFANSLPPKYRANCVFSQVWQVNNE